MPFSPAMPSQAMPCPEPGSRPQRWRRVVAALVAVFMAVMIVNIGYQDETRVSSCTCGNNEDERIIRVLGITLSHQVRVEPRVRLEPGHVHRWDYYGGCTDYGFGGWLGASCVN